MSAPHLSRWPRAAAGLVGVAGNLLGVVFLYQMPSAYRMARLSEWAQAVLLAPAAASASGVAFTLGLIGVAVWALMLREQLDRGAARAGALVIACGALLNAAGTPAPLVLGYHLGAADAAAALVGRGLLGMSLCLDACFNLCLGAGLLAIAGAWPRGAARGPRLLAALAGLASLPVSAQALYDPAADLLKLAAPLWLSFILITALRPWSTADASPARR